MAEHVLERTQRTVGHRHRDRLVGALDGHRGIEVELAAAFDRLGGPGVIVLVRPWKDRQAERRAVVGPVHHILRGIQAPIAHDEALRVVLVVAGVQVHRVANNQRRGIGREAGLDDGIVRQRGQTGAMAGGEEGGLANFLL
jgi:hypothetical protein